MATLAQQGACLFCEALAGGAIDFSGTWVRDNGKSTSPAPQLKAMGVGWFKRKAAANVTPTARIEHNTAVRPATWTLHLTACCCRRQSGAGRYGFQAQERKAGARVG